LKTGDGNPLVLVTEQVGITGRLHWFELLAVGDVGVGKTFISLVALTGHEATVASQVYVVETVGLTVIGFVVPITVAPTDHVVEERGLPMFPVKVNVGRTV
jgi:hypothetical protein